MGTYQTVKCPNCKNYLKFFEMKNNFGSFGTPIIKCDNCNQLLRTGKKLWRDLNLFLKVLYYLQMIFSCLVFGMMGPIIGGILIWGERGVEEKMIYVLPIGVFLSICLLIYQIRVLKFNIKAIEEDFDKEEFELKKY